MNKNYIETIDLNLIKVFVAVYEAQSATIAAERLDITQSAVSISLRKLRKVYKNLLFMRTGRGLSPTLMAQHIYPHLRDALDRCQLSIQVSGSKDISEAGRTLVFGLSDDFEIVLGSKLAEIAERVEGCSRLHFSQSYAAITAEMLLSRAIDLGISVGGYARDGISSFDICQSTYGCLLDPNSFKNVETLTLENLLRHDHIMVSRSGFFGIVDDVLANMGYRRKVRLSTSHFSALPYLLSGTNCITVLPRHAAKAIAAMSNLKYVPCPIEFPEFTISLLWRTHSSLDIVVRNMVNAIKENKEDLANLI